MIRQAKKSLTGIQRSDIPYTDIELLRRYTGIDSIPCCIQSPLREDDYRPSFSLFERDGSVYWKDFGTGEGGNIVKFLALLWHTSYAEALQQMKEDNLPQPNTKLRRTYSGQIQNITGSTMKVAIRDWQDWDIEFWESFGIPKRFCEWCNVHPVSHVIFTKKIDGKQKTVTVSADKYAYAYFEWKDNKESIKLYQPFSQSMKWLSKHDASVWDLWKHAFNYAKKVSDEAVILTSSRKDAMCLWYNLRVPSMSLQGEGYIPKPQVMQQVFDRFKTVYLWYDNDFTHTQDNPGQDNAKKLVERYPNLHNICIPEEYQCKDPSDLVKHKGAETLKKLFNKLRQ